MHHQNHHHTSHVSKTYGVFVLTLLVSILEIYIGLDTHSHALKTDGWHLITHVVIFGMAILAYSISPTRRYYIPILDYTGLLLGIFLLLIGVFNALDHLFLTSEHQEIDFAKAILVMCVSITLNLFNFFILKPELACGDNNLKAIYLHVISDLLTSFGALAALLLGHFCHWLWVDRWVAIAISIIIIKFSFTFTWNVYKKLRS